MQKTTKIGNTSRLSRDGTPAASRALNVKSSLKSFTLTPYFAYGMFGNERASVDALGGLRYYHAGTQIDAEVRNFGKQTVATSDNWGRQILRIFLCGDSEGNSNCQLKKRIPDSLPLLFKGKL